MTEETIKAEYIALKHTGMFFEFFPNLTGLWSLDKEEFTKFYNKREANRNKLLYSSKLTT